MFPRTCRNPFLDPDRLALTRSVAGVHPSELIGDLRAEWLIHEYLATQPTQFAYLLGSGFIRNEILPTPLMA